MSHQGDISYIVQMSNLQLKLLPRFAYTAARIRSLPVLKSSAHSLATPVFGHTTRHQQRDYYIFFATPFTGKHYTQTISKISGKIR